MKFLKILSSVCISSIILTGCLNQNNSANQTSNEPDKTTLTVFAAASMTETLQEIGDIYENQNENIDIIFSFDSSGTLKKQIEQGAICDVFISAAQKQMNQLDIKSEENVDKLDFINSNTRVDLLENEVVLITSKNSNTKVTSFENIENASLISLGNSDVPVGQYSEQIFKNLNLWESLNNSQKISFASNVKEVVSQVANNAVECGVVYSTDVTEDNLKIIAKAPENTHDRAVYPAAVTTNSENPEQAENFLKFLSSETCKEIFSKAGFKPLT